MSIVLKVGNEVQCMHKEAYDNEFIKIGRIYTIEEIQSIDKIKISNGHVSKWIDNIGNFRVIKEEKEMNIKMKQSPHSSSCFQFDSENESEEPSQDIKKSVPKITYEEQQRIAEIEEEINLMTKYILHKLKIKDWHGIYDSAIDIRCLAEEIKWIKEKYE